MSNRTEPGLREIQAWLHTFLVAPGTSQQALEAAEAEAGLSRGSADALISPSPALAPQERLEIYRRMYLLRMEEALEIDFPAVRDRTGRELFSGLVASYVNIYPSNSYTLDHLGHRFDEFLREHSPSPDSVFLSELASLEWAVCTARIAIDSPTLIWEALAGVDPEEFLEMHFECVPHLKLLTFQHNVNEIYGAWGKSGTWAPPTMQQSHLIIWRQDMKVWRCDLTSAAHEFLGEIAQGRPLGEALDHTLDRHKVDEQLAFKWFQNWLNDGLFSRYHL